MADQLVELVRQGLSIPKVAGKLNVSASTVYTWLQRNPGLAERVNQAREEAIRAHRRSAKGPGTQPRTEDKVATILQALENGCTRPHSAAMAGVGATTFERWLSEDPELERQVMAAEGACQDTNLAIVRKAANSSWQAAAWLLERRFGYVVAREVPAAERARMAARVGAGLADLLIKGLAEADLDADAQERVRRKLTEALREAAG